MTLIAIQNYFLQVKKANFSHLAKEFKMDEEILQDMLSFWIKKGKLKKTTFETGSCNTGCNNCKLGCFSSLKKNLPQMPVYEWVG